jgi:phosphoenolpyruvate synthase/pyruvate phosphate dikinase
MFLFPLTDIIIEQDFGGKASGLSKINSFGLNVPKGFAVHKDAYKYYALYEQFPPELKEELKEKLSALEGASLIVRSSAIGEDADDFSFAGQLDSYVVENNIQAVIEGVTKCWDSIYNSRAAAYQNISGSKLCEMGVVIQQFIEADYSGVLFTQSPKNKNHTYVEYVKGGAEPLVSGKVTPFSFSVNGDLELIVHSELPFNHKTLVNSAMHLKGNFKKHLDIEWILFRHDPLKSLIKRGFTGQIQILTKIIQRQFLRCCIPLPGIRITIILKISPKFYSWVKNQFGSWITISAIRLVCLVTGFIII